MSLNEWEKLEILREALRIKAVLLMRHEGKPYAKTGLDISNHEPITVSRQEFYVVSTPVFRDMVERTLIEATETHPELFGTGNAEDVLEALYRMDPIIIPRERFAHFLSEEQFAYVFQITDDGGLNNRVLRIDLFRQLKKNLQDSYDFVGGILHAYKHYSYNHLPLSTGREIHDIHPRFILVQLIKAFFIVPGHQTTPTKYQVSMPYDDTYAMQFGFYFEEKTQVYFVNTAFRKSLTKSTRSPEP